jgi:phage baseplate assembly protein W
MASDPTTNFLGSGPAYPLRAGKAGLPDIDLAVGVDAVHSSIAFLLRTTAGELGMDPSLGMDPDVFRFRGANNRTKNEMSDAINASLRDGEPRVEAPKARVSIESRNRKAEIHVDFRTIRRQVARNRVLLPARTHRDALRAFNEDALAIQGYMDGIDLGFDVGPAGGD